MKQIFTLLSVCMSLLASAQTSFQTLVLAKAFYTDNNMTQLKDGSFVDVAINGSLTGAVLITKLNAAGTFTGGKTVIVPGGSPFYSTITSTSDGGFAVSTLISFTTLSLQKFTADLTLQWSKLYTASVHFTGNSKLLQTPDGFLITADVVKSNVSGGIDAALLKTDSNGNALFLKKYFLSTFSETTNLVATADGNYVLLGIIDSISQTPQDQNCITKISPDGKPLWSVKTGTGSQVTGGTCLMVTAAGDILVGGTVVKDTLIDDDEGGTYESWEQLLLTKYDSSGHLLWSERTSLADNADTHTLFMKEDSQGNYLLCGYVQQYQGTERSGIYSFRMGFDTAGRWQWTKRKGEQYEYYGIDCSIATQDSGFIISGYSYRDDTTHTTLFTKFGADAETCSSSTRDSTETIDTLGTASVQPTEVTDVAVATSDIAVTIDSAGTGKFVCASGLLPVKLLSFTANVDHKQVAVAWTAANEINAGSYTVERSPNGNVFIPVHTTGAKSNGAGIQTYTTTDVNPMPGTSYYRLKETDKNGAVTHSQVVPVVFSRVGSFLISPNPVVSNIRVLMQSSTPGNAMVQVSDMAGKVLLTQRVAISKGLNTILLPASGLSRGMYVMKMIQDNQVQSVKFVKE